MNFATNTPARLVLAVTVLFLGLTTHPAMSASTLNRVPRSWFYGPQAMWTAGDTGIDYFFPMSPAVETAGILTARFAYQLTQDTGDCKLRPAVRFSNDKVVWDTPKEVESEYADANDEIVYKTAYVDLLSLAATPNRAYMQFGLMAKNRSTSSTAFCYGTLRIEPKEF